MRKQKILNKRRVRRSFRVRKVMKGSTERPRLSVYRSHRNLTAQIIDDSARVTLVSASTEEKAFSGYGGNAEAAKTLGKLLAERAKAAGIEKVCFDRGHYRYHGRVAALADAVREGGLSF